MSDKRFVHATIFGNYAVKEADDLSKINVGKIIRPEFHATA